MSKLIEVYVNGKKYSVPVDEIIYMEKDLRKIAMHTKKGTIVFYGKFCDVLPSLDERFAHCHRSYIFNMDEISSLSDGEVTLSNDDVIRFGVKCFRRLENEYGKYFDQG